MEVRRNRLMRVIVLIIGILFIAYGVHRGEVDTVFSKAIRICLECVGIG